MLSRVWRLLADSQGAGSETMDMSVTASCLSSLIANLRHIILPPDIILRLIIMEVLNGDLLDTRLWIRIAPPPQFRKRVELHLGFCRRRAAACNETHSRPGTRPFNGRLVTGEIPGDDRDLVVARQHGGRGHADDADDR